MSVPPFTDKDLYGASGGPQSADIVQGPLGDCYLLSSLGSAPLWPQVMESAYAKLNVDRTPETMQDELKHIEGGYPKNAIYALTGQRDETLSAHKLSNLDKAYEQLQQAIQEGRPMMLSTNPMKDTPNDGLIKGVWNDVDPSKSSGHACMLEGVSKDKDDNVMLTLRNPWGNNKDPNQGVDRNDPIVEVNLKQVIDNGHLQSIDRGPRSLPASRRVAPTPLPTIPKDQEPTRPTMACSWALARRFPDLPCAPSLIDDLVPGFSINAEASEYMLGIFMLPDRPLIE